MRKTLQNIILATSLSLATLIPNKLRADVIDITVNDGGDVNVQDYVDMANAGDTLNFIGDYMIINTPSFTDSKGLIYEGNSKLLQSDNIIINGNASSTFNNFGDFYGVWQQSQSVFTVNDSASLNVSGAFIANANNGIVWNSNGKLNIENCTLNGVSQSAIVLNNLNSTINIDRNFFSTGNDGITINGSIGQSKYASMAFNDPQLNILNNTMTYQTQAGIKINGTVNNNGYIANNNIALVPDAVQSEVNSPNIVYDHNNYFEGNGTFNLASSRPMSSSTTTNFSFDPLFYSGYGSPVVDSSSPLYYNGVYIDGKTTYFQDADHTYIGSDNSTMPVIPEPSTKQLIIGGLAGLVATIGLRRKHGK